VKTTKRKLSELVFDFDLYPRTSIDSQHVSAMREAARAGATFPPYVVCAKTLRVVDGFHRGRKDRLEHGVDCEVECVEKVYKNDGELFLDAMRCNAAHGRGLTPIDKARCALKCKHFHLGVAAIAAALGVTPAAIKAVGEGRVARAPAEPGRPKGELGEEIIIKRSIEHLSGTTLSVNQREANKRLSGMPPSFHANQLLLVLENDFLNLEDQSLLALLGRLHAALERFALASAVVA
jgi:hypothetical protein